MSTLEDQRPLIMSGLTSFELNYSKKDIPLPSDWDYKKRLTHAISALLHKMCWHIHFVQNPDDKKEDKETYEFKSERAPPQTAIKVLEGFMKDLLNVPKNLLYRNHSGNKFQTDLNNDIKKIKNNNEVIVSADKSRKYYKIEKTQYKQLVKNNVTSEYRKASNQDLEQVNKNAKEIACQLDLADRMEQHTTQPCFLTLKDHKDNFGTKDVNNKPARLINPAKSDVGKVSKIKLTKINQSIRKATKLNQWQSTPEVLDWFKDIWNKQDYSFVKFDIVSFYPSISEDLLIKAIRWAKNFHHISDDDFKIFLQARQNFLFFDGEPWVKKSNPRFDVTMGSPDGAEVAEVVGLYLLQTIIDANIGFSHQTIGLYRDDGLSVFRGSSRTMDVTRKKLIKIFKSHNLQVTIETGAKSTDFLHVTLHLNNGSFEPFRKDSLPPMYINKNSNHPPAIRRNLPAMIEKRVSGLCSSQEIFNNHKTFYENALGKSGYQVKLQYKPTKNAKKTSKRQRWPKVFWFNPPWNAKIKTNIGKMFLALINKHFPVGSQWHRHFNRNTLKLSYSCTKNIASHISQHNFKVLNPKIATDPNNNNCNCRQPLNCPLNGQCKTSSIVYQANIESQGKQWVYFGMTSKSFKERYNNHRHTIENPAFANEEGKNGTRLSSKIWSLKKAGKPYTLKFKIANHAHTYRPGTKRCDLCLAECTRIIVQHKGPEKYPSSWELLNKRSEVLAKCRHKRRYKLLSLPT